MPEAEPVTAWVPQAVVDQPNVPPAPDPAWLPENLPEAPEHEPASAWIPAAGAPVRTSAGTAGQRPGPLRRVLAVLGVLVAVGAAVAALILTGALDSPDHQTSRTNTVTVGP